MRGSARGKNRHTKHCGKYQGEKDKVKEENDLKDERSDGENLPKNVVADTERTVQGEWGDDRP